MNSFDGVEIINRIKALRIEKGMSMRELAKAVRISPSALSRYENRQRSFPINDLPSFARALSVDVEYLLGTQNNKRKIPAITLSPDEGITIVSFPELTNREIESIEYSWNLKKEFGNDIFAIRIIGDSMEPRISIGDIVIIKQQSNVKNGEIALVITKQNIILRKVKYHPHGLHFATLNFKKDSDFFTHDEIKEQNIRILGKAVKLIANL